MADTAVVYGSAYFSLNGTTRMLNGGSFQFGSGSGVDRHDIKPCDDTPFPESIEYHKTHNSVKGIPCVNDTDCEAQECCSPSHMCEPCTCNSTSPCPNGGCCNSDGTCYASACYFDDLFCCGPGVPCEAYQGAVYCGGYARYQEERRCQSYLKLEPIPPHVALKMKVKAGLVQVTRRYSFLGGVIDGDGTGSIVATEPLELKDHVTLRRANLFAMTEFGEPPFVGGGTLHVVDRGHLILGLDSVLREDGHIIVGHNGRMLIPRHGQLLVANHSIRVAARTAVVQVDGRLTLGKAARFASCGHALRHGDGHVHIQEQAVTDSNQC